MKMEGEPIPGAKAETIEQRARAEFLRRRPDGGADFSTLGWTIEETVQFEVLDEMHAMLRELCATRIPLDPCLPTRWLTALLQAPEPDDTSLTLINMDHGKTYRLKVCTLGQLKLMARLLLLVQQPETDAIRRAAAVRDVQERATRQPFADRVKRNVLSELLTRWTNIGHTPTRSLNPMAIVESMLAEPYQIQEGDFHDG